MQSRPKLNNLDVLPVRQSVEFDNVVTSDNWINLPLLNLAMSSNLILLYHSSFNMYEIVYRNA